MSVRTARVGAAGLVAGLLAAAAAACAYPSVASPASTAVQITDDPYQPHIAFVGPLRSTTGNLRSTHRLRSWLTREGQAATHQVYVTVRYGGDWRFYESARDLSGALEFVSIDRDVDCSRYGCTYIEDFGVTVPDTLLRSSAATGYRFKAYSRVTGTDVEILVGTDQIQPQLAAIDSVMAP